MRSDILRQMGVQEWRLRTDLSDQLTQVDDEQDIVVTGSQADIKGPDHLALTMSKDAVIQGGAVSSSLETDIKGRLLEKTEKMYAWSDLMSMLSDHKHCPSCGLSQPVLGDGDTSAQWMFVFDSPSSRDVQQQRLLTGRVGQLFDAILFALNLRREDVYLTSIFKCPPASDISLDKAQCDDVIYHQVKLVQPTIIIAFGEFSAQAMIKSNDDLDQLRKNKHSCVGLPNTVVPTYGLIDMLDKPTLKARVWEDLKMALQVINS